jgi:hypothetical protein
VAVVKLHLLVVLVLGVLVVVVKNLLRAVKVWHVFYLVLMVMLVLVVIAMLLLLQLQKLELGRVVEVQLLLLLLLEVVVCLRLVMGEVIFLECGVKLYKWRWLRGHFCFRFEENAARREAAHPILNYLLQVTTKSVWL